MILVPFDDDESNKVAEPDVKPLTAPEAHALRQKLHSVSPWRLVCWQLVVGLVLTGMVWMWVDRADWVASVGYGALCVVLPNALFARGLARGQKAGQPGGVLVGFFVWELVKVVVTVAMLVAAPKLMVGLNWLALLVGFVVTMKVSWVAVWYRLVCKKSV